MGWVCKRIRFGITEYCSLSDNRLEIRWTIDKSKAYVFYINDVGFLAPGESWEAVDIKTTLDPDMEEACFAD